MFFKLLSDANYGLVARLISENFRTQARWYAIAIAAMLVVAGMTSVSAWIIRDIVNETVVSRDLARVLQIAGLVAAIFALKGMATYTQDVFLNKAGNNIIARTQQRIYEHVLKQDVAFYTRYPSSDLLMRLTTNAQAARGVLDLIVTSFVRDLFSLIGLMVVMVIQQPILSLIALIVGPLAIIGVRQLTLRVRKIMEAELASIGKIIEAVQETATGVRVIKAFGLERHMQARMARYVADVETRSNSIARLEAASSPIMETLSGFAIAIVTALNAIWVLKGGHSPGELISFIAALLLAYEPAKRLARMRISLESGLIGVRMMYELLDTPIGLVEKPDASDLPGGPGDIRLSQVRFGYGNGHPVFDNLDLVFEAGKTTALVGQSGGGKSSIVNLVMRLYDPECGCVTIDGHDLRDVTFRSLRERIAYVGQDAFLFSGTIRHNIALGKVDASEEDIIEAAKAAHAHDFIQQLPQGYDSDAGENGGKLSGGQKQRITIARAMLRKADILILDEPTSALDSVSESLIQSAMARLTKNRTTIIIAHRFSTIAQADNIVVMEKGRIVEAGPQAVLLSRDGPYRDLYRLQSLQGEETV